MSYNRGMTRQRFFTYGTIASFLWCESYSPQVSCAAADASSADWVPGRKNLSCLRVARTWLIAPPGYMFTGLSHMDWVTWIAPHNKVVNHLFGYSHVRRWTLSWETGSHELIRSVQGLGMSLVSLDWAQIAYLGSPLSTPCTFYWQSASQALTLSYRVGGAQRSVWFRLLLLDARANSLLYQHMEQRVSSHQLAMVLRQPWQEIRCREDPYR